MDSVLVYSPGTVGSRVAHALCVCRAQKILDLSEITVFKRTPDLQYYVIMDELKNAGVKFTFLPEKIEEFAKLGFRADYTREEALQRANILIDCSDDGVPTLHKPDYLSLAKQCRMFVCQGAEEDREFGKGPLIYGVNHDVFDFNEDHWIQIGSCNTHAGSFLLRALAFKTEDDGTLSETGLVDADFAFVRRSLDLSQKSKTVTSTEVSKFSSAIYGTHHAEDIAAVFELKGIDLCGRVTSSAIKINEPYFHVTRFAFVFEAPIDVAEVKRRLEEERKILFSTRNLTHYAFDIGTRYGFMGRFSNPVIAVNYTVLPITRGRFRVIGHAFTPQDGNFLLSNLYIVVAALYKDPAVRAEKMQILEKMFLRSRRRI